MKIAEDWRRAVLQAAIEGRLTGGSLDKWRFVELNEIFHFVDYRGMTPIKNTEGICLITASNIRKGYMDYTRKEYISADEYCRRLGRGVTEKGDLLFTTEAPMGHVSICDLEQCSCGQRIITLKARAEVINKLYMYFILSDCFQKQLLDNCTGTTAKGIKADKLKRFLVPLPPIDEQRRIVSRLDAILAKIAELEAAENELYDQERRFPGDMRDALLQAAIEGQLTGGKRESWRWVRLGDVGTFVRGHGIKKSDTTETGKPCIRYEQLYTTFKTSFSEAVSFVPNEIFQKSVKVHKNDILMALTGENNVDIALTVAYTGDDEIAMGGDMTKFTTTIDPMYVVYFMNSPFAISHKSKLATGNIIVHISNDKLASIPLPLPPLEE